MFANVKEDRVEQSLYPANGVVCDWRLNTRIREPNCRGQPPAIRLGSHRRHSGRHLCTR